MDYKEKLEEAKRLYETANADQKYLLESLFPELKSRAYDRIRKNCIHFLKLQKSHHASTVEIDECIDWLEGQVKESLILQPETKTCKENDDSLTSEDERIRQELIHLVKKSHEYGGYALHKYEADRMLAWIEKQGEQKPVNNVEPLFGVGDTIRLKGSNAEYVIESISNGRYYGRGFSIEISGGNRDYELVSSKSAWSEENEEEFQIAIDTLVEAGQRDSAHWLKSLKDRYTWKPTEEQISALEYHLNNTWYESWQYAATEQLLNDLKKL